MTIHSLYPAYVLMRYHSKYAPHTMVVPTRAWNALAGTNGKGGFEAWDASDVDAVDMIEELATALSYLQWSDGSAFDDWTIFTLASETDPPLPRATGTLGLAGQDDTPGYTKAVQFTYTFYDTGFNTAKIVLLDAASNGDFAKRNLATLSSDELAVATHFMADTNAWASRAGFQPNSVRSLAKTLNEELRKSYGDS